MSENRAKLGEGRAVALVGLLAVGALAVACVARAPAEPKPAIGQAVAGDGGEAAGSGAASLAGDSTLVRWFDAIAAPVVFVDDLRMETRADLPEAVRQWVAGGLRDRNLVPRHEVVEGPWHVDGRTANQVILIFTGRTGPAIEPTAGRASAASVQWQPLVFVDGQRLPLSYPEIPTNLAPFPFDRARRFMQAVNWDPIARLEIESLEIIHGAAAVHLYGEEAAVGVIAIVTKDSGSRRSGTSPR